MNQPPVKQDTDILRYWSSKEYQFPTIARIARDHLAIPATSAASESVFSHGGDIVTEKRNRLGACNTRRLLCLRDWGVLAEGKDDSGILRLTLMRLIVGNSITFGLLATIIIVFRDTIPIIPRNLKIGLIYPDTLGIVFGIVVGEHWLEIKSQT